MIVAVLALFPMVVYGLILAAFAQMKRSEQMVSCKEIRSVVGDSVFYFPRLLQGRTRRIDGTDLQAGTLFQQQAVYFLASQRLFFEHRKNHTGHAASIWRMAIVVRCWLRTSWWFLWGSRLFNCWSTRFEGSKTRCFALFQVDQLREPICEPVAGSPGNDEIAVPVIRTHRIFQHPGDEFTLPFAIGQQIEGVHSFEYHSARARRQGPLVLATAQGSVNV